ncbi:MAG: serine acetyltransferase [Armatimonadota bacterium]
MSSSDYSPSFVEKLVYLRRKPVVGKLAYYMLVLFGADIPRSVPIGKHFRLQHWGIGVVIHNLATIGDRVNIFNGVTVGRADAYRKKGTQFEGIVIEDDVMLGTGCKVLCKEGILRVGKGTSVGANAVLLQSTGEYEIWVGAPARCIGKRDPEDINL